ncbi:hypothetical protein N9D37_00270 [Erythrobacter sp.]|nr:hypothetical protein [Erythrobacter sp.]
MLFISAPRRLITLCLSAALLAGGVTAAPSAALACNPDGCNGISKEELARDKAEIRRLNREQLRYVRERDARYAKGWEATRQYPDKVAAHQQRVVEHERRMQEWRDAVRRCEAGDHRYCAR